MFTPHTTQEREAMLRVIGIENLEELFQSVPAQYRFPELNLPPAITEMEAFSELQYLSGNNASTRDLSCFLGAGAYNHYIPAAVDALLRRGEFYTAYTPYQPEISQGTLQAIFDYQSLIVALTGMDVSNASHYDGATAVAEAVTLAFSNYRGKRNKVILSPNLHPHYLATVKTYNQGTDLQVVVPEFSLTGNPERLLALIDDKTALVMVQYPDFLGRIYDYTQVGETIHKAGGLFGISVNPLALGLLRPPSEFGADIVTGEGQPLGIPLSFGGPYLGIFATKLELVRKMAGRLVGETVDTHGRRAYVLTLTAREQHIRREKATSNICTNQGLMALASAIYLSLLGKNGLKQVAELCYHKAHYAASKISDLKSYSVINDSPFFNEFIVHCPKPVWEINNHLLDYDVLGGFDLGEVFPEMSDYMLVAVTEMNSREEIDTLVELLEEVSHD